MAHSTPRITAPPARAYSRKKGTTAAASLAPMSPAAAAIMTTSGPTYSTTRTAVTIGAIFFLPFPILEHLLSCFSSTPLLIKQGPVLL